MRRARLKNLAALPKVEMGDVLPAFDRISDPSHRSDVWNDTKQLRPVTTMHHEAVGGETIKGSRALKRTGGTYNAGRNEAKRMRRAAQRGQ